MPPVPFDGPVPGWSPGGSYGHSRLLSCSFGLWPVHLVPADGSFGLRDTCNSVPGKRRARRRSAASAARPALLRIAAARMWRS